MCSNVESLDILQFMDAMFFKTLSSVLVLAYIENSVCRGGHGGSSGHSGGHSSSFSHSFSGGGHPSSFSRPSSFGGGHTTFFSRPSFVGGGQSVSYGSLLHFSGPVRGSSFVPNRGPPVPTPFRPSALITDPNVLRPAGPLVRNPAPIFRPSVINRPYPNDGAFKPSTGSILRPIPQRLYPTTLGHAPLGHSPIRNIYHTHIGGYYPLYGHWPLPMYSVNMGVVVVNNDMPGSFPGQLPIPPMQTDPCELTSRPDEIGGIPVKENSGYRSSTKLNTCVENLSQLNTSQTGQPSMRLKNLNSLVLKNAKWDSLRKIWIFPNIVYSPSV